MADYVYRAAHGDGRVRDGRVAAPSSEAALRQLQAQGLTPLRIAEADGATAGMGVAGDARAGRRFARDGGLDAADIHALTGELAVMLRAGLPLDRALRVLLDMAAKPAVAGLADELLKAVKAGKGLSQALSTHQAAFGEFYINMVRSGEAGGQLAEVLGRLAEHLERVKALRESVVSALIYPAVLVAVAAVSVFLMLGFVVPQFESLFDDMGEALPLPTRIIVAGGHLVADWGWLMALAAAAVLWLGRRWLATPAGRGWRDAQVLKLPVLGGVVRKYEVSRFARSMGTLLGNGVPIVHALRIASDTMANQHLRGALAGVVPAIKQGGRLADALGGSGLFGPLALNMLRLGEETGRLDEMLLELARVADGEVQAGVKRALTLLEPLLILVLGAVIAAIIVSILLGILSVNDLAT